ncbi:hypothetical protein NMG60_11013812 [Bertholletia excelsa]
MGHEKCGDYLVFSGETALGNEFRALTARFFQSMASVVKDSRPVVEIDSSTNTEIIRHEKHLEISFPQISLASIDAIRNIGQVYAGAGELKKISDVGVWLVELLWSFWAYVWLYIILEVWTPNIITLWEALLTVLQYGLLLIHAYAQDKRWPYLSLPFAKGKRPEDWVPEEADSYRYEPVNNACNEYSGMHQQSEDENSCIVDICSIHSQHGTAEYSKADFNQRTIINEFGILSIWKQQFVNALMLESAESINLNDMTYMRLARKLWKALLLPWKLLFALVPPYQIAHGWIAFVCSLIFISGIAYIVTRLTDLISCVTGINPYVIAFTALASGTSWPDLVASKIVAEHQIMADSAIANITCSNSVNIYVGIGVPWLIDTAYNFIALREPLRIQNAKGLGFSLIIFFCTFIGCIAVILGGPKPWAWLTSVYLMLLWVIFVVLSSLKVSGVI